MTDETQAGRPTAAPGSTLGEGQGRASERRPMSGTSRTDPLAEKHRSASFEKDWRAVNYSRLNVGRDAAEPLPNRCRDSDLLRADWSPTPKSKDGTKAFPAKFASFVGGPFHAEIVRLPAGRDKATGSGDKTD